MNKDWHGQHFCCWQCDESLTGQRYVLRDEHPYCVSCYESVFANACEKCSRTIGIDSKVRSARPSRKFDSNVWNFSSGPFLQRQALARSVLLVHNVRGIPRGQAVWIEGRQDLLRALLWRTIRLQMWRLPRNLQSRYVIFAHINQNPTNQLHADAFRGAYSCADVIQVRPNETEIAQQARSSTILVKIMIWAIAF